MKRQTTGLLILLFSLLITGCEKKSPHVIDRGNILITPKNSGIDEVTVMKWKVGPLHRQTVSKGISLRIKFPQLDNDLVKDLALKKGIDSWLVRLKRKNMGTSETMAYLYMPFTQAKAEKTTNLRIRQVNAGTINIYYAAAAISPRFENFMCPAFDHKKMVTEASLKRSVSMNNTIMISGAEEQHLNVKFEPFSVRPVVINAGKDLLGDYVIEMALLNRHEQKLMSSWYESENYASVTDEDDVFLKGCDNFKIPDPERNIRDGIESFKWNKK